MCILIYEIVNISIITSQWPHVHGFVTSPDKIKIFFYNNVTMASFHRFVLAPAKTLETTCPSLHVGITKSQCKIRWVWHYDNIFFICVIKYNIMTLWFTNGSVYPFRLVSQIFRLRNVSLLRIYSISSSSMSWIWRYYILTNIMRITSVLSAFFKLLIAEIIAKVPIAFIS